MKHPTASLLSTTTLLLVALSSCNSKTDSSDNIIKINLDSTIEAINTEEGYDLSKAENIENCGIIDGVEYVRLETSDDALIGDVEKIIVTDDRIFVANLREFECCHIFDRKG